MSIWGFISDVHGNLPALERAIAACRATGAERLAYLGDLLGPRDADGCVRLVRATADLSVVGNRDLDWADRVSGESRAYVLGLPRLAVSGDFVAVHGDGRLTRGLSSDERRRGFRRAYAWLRERDQRVLFFGHTHQSRVWRKSSAEVEPELLAGPRVRLRGGPEEIFVVNVGTTGMPFPGKGAPSCAVYDESSGWLEHLPIGEERRRRV